ncbi:MAG: DUF4136 domain-containing protein [Bacteroidales bacterium]
MKKFMLFFVAFLLFASCEKEPDKSMLNDSYLVYTKVSDNAHFSVCNTFYLPDSVLVITSSKDPVFWTGEKHVNAQKILSAYVTNMEKRGFKRVFKKAEADLGLQVSFIENVNYFVDTEEFFWWLAYPGYWYPGYWGDNWSGLFYGYSVMYTYSTGSLLTEIVDRKNSQKVNKILVSWNSYISGLLSGNQTIDINKTIEGIHQSFIQSPMIMSNPVSATKQP